MNILFCSVCFHGFSQTSVFSEVQLNFWQFFPRTQNMRNMKRKQLTDQRREKSIIKLFGLILLLLWNEMKTDGSFIFVCIRANTSTLKCHLIRLFSTDFIYGLSKIQCLPQAYGCQSSECGVIPIIDSNDGHEESIHGPSFKSPVI